MPRTRNRRPVVGVVLLLWIVLELWLLIRVADLIGGLVTALLLLAGAVVGGRLVRRAGVRAWRALAAAGTPGARPPENVTGDAVVGMAGGLLLILPGYLSDVLGLLCLLPPVRGWARRRVLRWAERQAVASGIYGAAARGGAHPTVVVEGEVVRDEPAPGRAGESDGPGPRRPIEGPPGN
ncbi:FxsA family protein [Allostreptomyces psammosilenae]|uniref:UPF0716 protein FxsA n=1 Tax=Allostreptomyces psammosilenae TaxID=1892865 RepID=A0A852ZPH9_9ACTN|nr:FxsA family protein [Allostreptomyces psammosilenae]NYI04269.1 UPF0716 protein FxsA [Allostreptomyces psammosilenae]